MTSEEKYNLLIEKIKEARKEFQDVDSHLVFFFEDESRDAMFDLKGDPVNIHLAICRAMDGDETVQKLMMASMVAWLKEHEDMKEAFIQALQTSGFMPGVN